MSGRESNETKCERSSRSKRHRMKEQAQSTHSDGSDSKLKRRSACSKDKRKKSRRRSSSSSSSSSSTSSHEAKLQKLKKKQKDCDERSFKEYKNGIVPQRMDRSVNNYKSVRNYNMPLHNFRERGNTIMRASYKYGRFYNRNRRIPYNNYQYYRRNNEGRSYYTHYNNRVPNYNRSRNNHEANIDYHRNFSNKDTFNQFMGESNSRDSSSKQDKCSLKIDKIHNIKSNVDTSYTKIKEKRKTDSLERKSDNRIQKKRKRRSFSSSSSSSTSSTSSVSSSSSSTSSSSSSSTSTSTNSTSSSDSSEDERKRQRQKKKAKRVKKNVKKHRKKRKLKKNSKKKLKKSSGTESRKRTLEKTRDTVTEIPPEMSERAKLMAPITKEEWEKKQSLIRRVYDEETGRYRLIKGEGEIIEEIVSRERHKEINRQATKGDGDYFQTRLKENIL